MTPRSVGGANMPVPNCRKRASTAACASGVRFVIIASVMPWRVNGGGLSGYGCDSASFSPSTSDGGTLRLPIGNSGSPVFRSKTYT